MKIYSIAVRRFLALNMVERNIRRLHSRNKKSSSRFLKTESLQPCSPNISTIGV